MTEANCPRICRTGSTLAVGAKAVSLAVEIPGDHRLRACAAEGIVLGAYRFTKYLTGERAPKSELERATILVQGKLKDDAKDAVAVGPTGRRGRPSARDLVNEPPNELFPARLAARAAEVCGERGLRSR